jgi:hypothetical protein
LNFNKLGNLLKIILDLVWELGRKENGGLWRGGEEEIVSGIPHLVWDMVFGWKGSRGEYLWVIFYLFYKGRENEL